MGNHGVNGPCHQNSADCEHCQVLESLLTEVRAGYDDYYESGSLNRLLNAESQILKTLTDKG